MNLEFKAVIMLIMEVMMIQIAIVENSWKMVIHQMIEMKDLMQRGEFF